MQIISGSMGKEIVHYTAPPASSMDHEMALFLNWWNGESLSLDGIIRAAVAHLRFVTVHPYEDGNGRIARALTDRALAQDEQTTTRLYSLSGQIMKNKKEYYRILEETQNGGGYITEWILWFIRLLEMAMENTEKTMEASFLRETFFAALTGLSLNSREKKIIDKLLEQEPEGFKGGMTNKKYVSLTKTSPATAKRDLQNLLNQGILIQNEGKGRSVSYRLNRELSQL
jgi:Fic family protein